MSINKELNAIKIKELNNADYTDNLANIIDIHVKASRNRTRTTEESLAEYRVSKMLKEEPAEITDKLAYLSQKCNELLAKYKESYAEYKDKKQSIEYVNIRYNMYFDVCDRLCSVLYTDMNIYKEKPVDNIDLNYIYSIGGMGLSEEKLVDAAVTQSYECLNVIPEIINIPESWQYIANGLSMLSYTMYVFANKKD